MKKDSCGTVTGRELLLCYAIPFRPACNPAPRIPASVFIQVRRIAYLCPSPQFPDHGYDLAESASVVRAEKNNGFSRHIIFMQESQNRQRNSIKPVRRAKKNRIIRFKIAGLKAFPSFTARGRYLQMLSMADSAMASLKILTPLEIMTSVLRNSSSSPGYILPRIPDSIDVPPPPHQWGLSPLSPCSYKDNSISPCKPMFQARFSFPSHRRHCAIFVPFQCWDDTRIRIL